MRDTYSGVALLTNAGCELGHAIALAIVDAGCRRIALADVSAEPLERIKEDIQKHRKDAKVLLMGIETHDSQEYESMVQSTASYFGEINYCINCATTNIASKPTAELEPETFMSGLNGTSRALWMCLRAELRQILSQPKNGQPTNSIVNIVPYGAAGVHSGQAVLAAAGYSKIGMMKSMARDHINDGIRINAVCPAITNSKEDQAGDSKVLQSNMRIPGRLIEIDEVAQAAVFLAGESSSGINGISLPVDAGWSMIHN